MAGPALIGCISIIIAVRPPLPIWLRLLPFDWLRRHSSAIYKLPQGCFFLSFPLLLLQFFSFHCQALTSVNVCVFHVLSLLQQCANTKGLRAVEDLIETKKERRYIYVTFEGERQSFSFTSETGLGK